MTSHSETDDLDRLLALLPESLQSPLRQRPSQGLIEIIIDLGRLPEARYLDQVVTLSDQPIGRDTLQTISAHIGELNADNRAGIEGTLHRISALRNRRGDLVGLTLRVGRAVYGTIDLIRDLAQDGLSTLLLGRPGVGKTTKLRELARVLADDLDKRVVIVDTSNEIAGDGDVPHPAIGRARRMQVPRPERQHAVMIEAVENHMPEVVIVDEIGTAEEALAARTIAERGVQLIATAHGNVLENLILNPTLADLIGGIQTVTLGDEEARLRGSQKTVSERKTRPTFDAVVEIVSREEVVVHRDTARAVDRLLAEMDPGGERRGEANAEAVEPQWANSSAGSSPRDRLDVRAPVNGAAATNVPVRIYPHALSRDSVERVIRDLRLQARTVGRPDQADMILALRSRSRDRRFQDMINATGLPLHVVKKNSTAQIRKLLQGIFNVLSGWDDTEVNEAVREAEAVARRVQTEGIPIALEPRAAALRKLQHRIAVRHHLLAEGQGSEPDRHLVIHPAG